MAARPHVLYRIQAGAAANGSGSDSDYVFDIAVNASNSVMAVSLSTNSICLYSPTTGKRLGLCCGHEDTVTQVAYVEQLSPNLLFSSSSDGTLRGWDVRSRSQVGLLRPNSSSREVWSFSCGGSSGCTVVAGVGAELVFWDWRRKQQQSCLDELHTEAVTQVKFHSCKHERVVSASVDGLVCTVDTSGNIAEEDALESVMNVGTSVSKFGFHGDQYKKIWCLTHIETLRIWNMDSSVMQADFGDIRSRLTSNWPLDSVDYLIDCQYSALSGCLSVLGGTRSGSVGVFPLLSDSVVGQASVILEGGHSEVVRSVWSGASSISGPTYWTGGEDGRLCSWLGQGHSDDKNGSLEEASQLRM